MKNMSVGSNVCDSYVVKSEGCNSFMAEQNILCVLYEFLRCKRVRPNGLLVGPEAGIRSL